MRKPNTIFLAAIIVLTSFAISNAQTTSNGKSSNSISHNVNLSHELNFNKDFIYYLPYEDKAYRFNANGTGTRFIDTSIIGDMLNDEFYNSNVTLNSLPFTWNKKSSEVITITTKGDYPDTYDINIVSSTEIKVDDTIYTLTNISNLPKVE